MAAITPARFQNLIVSDTTDSCIALNKILLQLPPALYELVTLLMSTDGTNISDEFRALVWPVGAFLNSGSLSAPPGKWLECIGQNVSRPIASGGSLDTYVALFAAIGTTYGAGDGATNFGIPDARGRALIGTGQLTNADATTGAVYIQGQKVGAESVILEMQHLPEFPPPLGTNVRDVAIRRLAGAGNVSMTAASSVFDVFDNSNVDGSGDPDEALNLNSNLGDGIAHTNVTPALVVRTWIRY